MLRICAAPGAKKARERRVKSAKRRAAAAPGGHVRSYFPEALYINPEILTDGNGNASIMIPLADSITTWRMAMFASTQTARWEPELRDLKVFQDFFVDLDLPVTLTQGDRVSIPVAVYNYSGMRGDVDLKLAAGGLVFTGQDASEQSRPRRRRAGRRGAIHHRSQEDRQVQTDADRPYVRRSRKREDTVVREIEVVPNGEAKEIVFNGRLETACSQTVRFPTLPSPMRASIFVRLYPGPLSQVIEGMDGILRMPVRMLRADIVDHVSQRAGA